MTVISAATLIDNSDATKLINMGGFETRNEEACEKSQLRFTSLWIGAFNIIWGMCGENVIRSNDSARHFFPSGSYCDAVFRKLLSGVFCSLKLSYKSLFMYEIAVRRHDVYFVAIPPQCQNTSSDLNLRCRLPNEGLDAGYWTENDLLITPANCTNKKQRCRYKECQLRNDSTCGLGYVYDLSEIKYSAINRWQIVCEWSVLKAFIQSTYYIGQMGGSLLFGFLGDRIGRKKVFFIAIIMLITSGVLMAVVPYWTAFALLRAAVGFAHPGIFVIAVIIGIYGIGWSFQKKSCFSNIRDIFSFGQIFLGCLAYFIRDYRYLQLAISLPALTFMCYWWIVPESARWLVAQHKYEEAHKILQRAAKINGARLPEKWWDQIDFPEKTAQNRSPQRKYNYLDLIRTPRIRLRTFACLFLWPVVSMIYYGVSMKTDFLGGDFYGTFIIGGIAEIPALLLLFAFIDRIGRKPLFAGGYFLAALCMLSNLLLPSEVIYTVTPELYPTVIRNSAMGCCSMIARVGANLSCYIVMWIVEQFGTWAMIIPFGSLSLMAGLVVIFCIPETMGKPLPETIEEIEQSFRSTNEEMLTLSNAPEKKNDLK
ncbi:hypothetical protein DINM_021309 [Dirofilaria immitis]|nr:hypothetical protein [Dirofilaria immitis]